VHHGLAVWDGKPARADGGTADVVADARERGTPVRVIWPNGAQRGQRPGRQVRRPYRCRGPLIYLRFTRHVPGPAASADDLRRSGRAPVSLARPRYTPRTYAASRRAETPAVGQLEARTGALCLPDPPAVPAAQAHAYRLIGCAGSWERSEDTYKFFAGVDLQLGEHFAQVVFDRARAEE
jgi:hypothetical protein